MSADPHDRSFQCDYAWTNTILEKVDSFGVSDTGSVDRANACIRLLGLLWDEGPRPSLLLPPILSRAGTSQQWSYGCGSGVDKARHE